MPSINAAQSGHFSIGGDLDVVRWSCCLSRGRVAQLIWKMNVRAVALVLSEDECDVLGMQRRDVWESSGK